MSKRFVVASLLALALMTGYVGRAAQTAPTVDHIQEFEFPDSRLIGLSPDGTKFAISRPWQEELCIFDSTTLTKLTCGSTAELAGGARLLDASWSPDSTRLAFGEGDVQYDADSDIWLMDATSGMLTNLTDDDFSGDLPATPTSASIYLDVGPAWTPDGQHLTFGRSDLSDQSTPGTSIVQIPANGGEVETLLQLPGNEPGIMPGKNAWSPDGSRFYITIALADSTDPDNGIWAFDPANKTIEQIETHPESPAPGKEVRSALLAVSPNGQQLLAWYPNRYNWNATDQEYPVLIDLPSRKVTPIEPPITISKDHPGFTVPAFSPDGSMLLGLTSLAEGNAQLWTIDLANGATTILSDALQDASVELGRTPTWGDNGTIMVARGPGAGYVLEITI